jgi:hypothetical protein
MLGLVMVVSVGELRVDISAGSMLSPWNEDNDFAGAACEGALAERVQ